LKRRGSVDGKALPAPATGHPLLLTLSCQPRPVPDKDQFSPPLQLTSVRGQITGTQVKLRAVIGAGQVTLSSLANGPMLVAVDGDSNAIASGIVPALQLRGKRKLVGTSADGSTAITITQPSATRMILTLQMRNPTLPQSGGAPVLVDVTLDGGGHIGRGEQLFRSSRNGKRLSPS
jgi:hypothetical protein